MRINSKGQVTIPADIRHLLGLHTGDEVVVTASGSVLHITKQETAPSHGQRTVDRMRGRATTELSTDELMAMLRDQDEAA